MKNITAGEVCHDMKQVGKHCPRGHSYIKYIEFQTGVGGNGTTVPAATRPLSAIVDDSECDNVSESEHCTKSELQITEFIHIVMITCFKI